jgi:hypothetical protein
MHKLRIQSEPWNDSFTLYEWNDFDAHLEIYRYAVSIERVERQETIIGPSLSLPFDSAQKLMNALWEAGLRPKDGAGSLAHVEATKAHLEDLRKLVFEHK